MGPGGELIVVRFSRRLKQPGGSLVGHVFYVPVPIWWGLSVTMGD